MRTTTWSKLLMGVLLGGAGCGSNLAGEAADAAGDPDAASDVIDAVGDIGGVDAAGDLGPRNVHYTLNLETGGVQERESLQDGIGVKTLVTQGPTKSITGITRANPGVVTSPNHGYGENDGITISGVAGMTQLNGRLFRARNVTANTYELWEDHAPGESNPDQTLGTQRVDTTAYGTYASGGSAMSWSEVIVNNGGGGPNSDADVRAMTAETVDGQLVQPRRGDYFLRSAIYYDKDYAVFSGNSGKNKPRWNGSTSTQAEFDYDTETWHGAAFFIPQGFEDETGAEGATGMNQLLDISEDSGPSGAGFFIVAIMVPGGRANAGGIAGNTAHWIGMESFSQDDPSSATYRYYDLGEVGPDKGKWTDFVIRSRVNPFAVPTNPGLTNPEARNKLYPANKGILQVWKATGPVDANGNRTMTLLVDRENEPVGAVPRAGHLIHTSVRQYKFGWHHNETSVDGPVWIGYDEIRIGETVRDGTGYQDVHPARLARPQ